MKRLILISFLFTNIISQDFDYNNIRDVFPSKNLSFKENQKYYENFKKQLITITENNPIDDNWFMLAQYIIDYSEDFDNDLEDASETINEALDFVLDGVTIRDIQNNPSNFSKHMYIMKRFIKYLEHTIYEESGSISQFKTFSKSEKAAMFIDKIGLINNFNNILTTDSKDSLLKDFVSRNLHTPILELMKSKEHPGVNIFLNNPGSFNANIVQYVFYENEDSIDDNFQIYIYKTDGELKTLDKLYHHVIDIEIKAETHPFFFENGKNVLRDKINLFHKYLELDFDSIEFSLNFFDLLIKPIIDYDKDFLNLDQYMLTQLKGTDADNTPMGPINIFILDNAISKIPLEPLLMTQDYFINNVLRFNLEDYEIGIDLKFFKHVDYINFNAMYLVTYANTLNEVVKSMENYQRRIEESPGFDELVEYYLQGKSEDEIQQLIDSFNTRDYLRNEAIDINIFSVSDFQSFSMNDLNKFNLPSMSNLKFVNEEVDAIHTTVEKWNNEYQTNIKSYNVNNSETSFKKTKFSKNDIIHIATHGFPLENDVSTLIFNKDINNDGFLTYREIQELNIDARLIILSACSTHIGDNYNNLHSLTIARAFKDIGLQNVIGTLWTVDDKATAKFMEIFYYTFLNIGNRNLAQTLNYTKLQMRQYYPNPHYWAGFVLYGF